jgi:hypothetical protein
MIHLVPEDDWNKLEELAPAQIGVLVSWRNYVFCLLNSLVDDGTAFKAKMAVNDAEGIAKLVPSWLLPTHEYYRLCRRTREDIIFPKGILPFADAYALHPGKWVALPVVSEEHYRRAHAETSVGADAAEMLRKAQEELLIF